MVDTCIASDLYAGRRRRAAGKMAVERQVTHEIVQPGLAQIIIAAEPVNTMTLKLWQALTDTFSELESDPAIRAVIFVSGLKRDVFTAGNDIGELYAPRTSLER